MWLAQPVSSFLLEEVSSTLTLLFSPFQNIHDIWQWVLDNPLQGGLEGQQDRLKGTAWLWKRTPVSLQERSLAHWLHTQFSSNINQTTIKNHPLSLFFQIPILNFLIKVHETVNWVLWALENWEAVQPRARLCYTETLENLPSRVPQQATLPTNIHFEGITWNHQSLQ